MKPRKKFSWQYGNRLDHLLAIERELRALLDLRFAPLGLTYAQLSVLQFIHCPKDSWDKPIEEPIRPADVAAHFNFAPRTVTEALNRLSNYVVKARNPQDRRSVVLKLTSKAITALEAAKQVVEKTQGEVFGQLSRTQDDAMWFGLPGIRNNIAQARRRDELRVRKSK